MSDTEITEDGWERHFFFYGRDEKDVSELASVYIEGLLDGAPDRYETETEYFDDWIRVIVKDKNRDINGV